MLPPQRHKLIPTHWGTYEIKDAESLQAQAWGGDEEPSPFWEGLNLGTTSARVARPAVRASFLEKQHRADGRMRGSEPFVEVDWATALDLAAAQIERVRKEHGNAAIYGGSYGWASTGRFHHAQSQIHRALNAMGGYTRSVNSYSYGAAEVILPHVIGSLAGLTGQHTTWASITEHTRLLVAFGGLPEKNARSNSGGVSRHHYRQTLERLKVQGAQVVSISPIRDDTNTDCQWLAIRPQTDVALMLALAYVLESENLVERSFMDRCTTGYERFRKYLLGCTDLIPKTPGWAAEICGIDASEITRLAQAMASSRTMIAMSWSLQRAQNGEQPYWMAIVLASMLGQIGQEGGGFGFGYAAINNAGIENLPFQFPALDQGRNPISSFIPVARIADMLLNKGQTYRYNGATLSYPDVRLVYWAGGNPFHHHQDLLRFRRAWSVPEVVIVNEPWWTASARHADIVFPVTVQYERNDIACNSRDPVLIAAAAQTAPFAEARTDYAVFAELAARLGCEEAFTEGRSEEQWLRFLYQTAVRNATDKGIFLPTFDEFWSAGHVEMTPTKASPLLRAFIDEPAKRPLKTPSGRIEIFSAVIEGFGISDQPGHPVWIEPREWLGSELARAFPLHLMSNAPSTKLHSQFDHAPHSLASKIAGREALRIHPDDATPRQISPGQIVRVFNDRGSCLAGAVVSDAVTPGVIQMATGAWLNLMASEDGGHMDVHGNPNVLTPDVGTSEIAQACSANSCLVEVEPYDDELPPITCFDLPDGLNETV